MENVLPVSPDSNITKLNKNVNKLVKMVKTDVKNVRLLLMEPLQLNVKNVLLPTRK